MGWPVRMYSEGTIYFVTSRTIQARLLMRPSVAVNEVMGGVLAQAAHRYSVKVYGFVFASNHLHLMVRAEGDRLSRFMGYLLGNIARKVGRLCGWRGPFWHRRYSSEPILDDASLVGRFKYLLAHGVKEGLVARCGEWPGLSCLPQLLGSAKRVFRWFNWTRRWNAGRKGREEEGRWNPAWAESVTLTLEPLPLWEGWDEKRRRHTVRAWVADIEREAARVRGSKPPLGKQAVLSQNPHDTPIESKRSPRPLCHAASDTARKAFRDTYRAFVAAYRQASVRWREGDVSAPFPPNAFRPGFPPRRLAENLLC